MPWRFNRSPSWTYNQRNLRRCWGRCFRFPWLPRWWWAYPEYWQEFRVFQLTPTEEKEMLKEELKALKEEIKVVEKRLKELETKKKK